MKETNISPDVLNILLADDDQDDVKFFREALEELPLLSHLTSVYDGEQLMQRLNTSTEQLPDVLFLDLNMPRKNGFACLEEIKRDDKLKHVPVIILSTSYQKSIADLLYKNGAHYYISKPMDFSQLKKIIDHALTLIDKNNPNYQSMYGEHKILEVFQWLHGMEEYVGTASGLQYQTK